MPKIVLPFLSVLCISLLNYFISLHECDLCVCAFRFLGIGLRGDGKVLRFFDGI